jgi:hypothetical protein
VTFFSAAATADKVKRSGDFVLVAHEHNHVLHVKRGWTWQEVIAFSQSIQPRCVLRLATQTRRRTVLGLACDSPDNITVNSLRQHLPRPNSDHRLSLVERDHVVRNATLHQLDAGVQSNAPQNLDRIDTRLPLAYDGLYHYDGRGNGQIVYIVDTGILPTHVQFEGRATALANTIDGTGPIDCHGHGTHVSSLAAGRDYGVAKRAAIRAIKCLDCSGSGTVSSVAAALAIVLEECDASPDTPFSINLSLNGPASDGLDAAVQSILNSCHACIAVAAGNSADDACNYSPSRVAGVLTIGSTDSNDAVSTFSNTGSCVDLYSPGENVVGAWYTSDTATRVLSGTSMATPLVTGTCAVTFGEARPLWQPDNRNAGTLVMNAVKAETTPIGDYSLLFADWDATQVLAPPPPPPPGMPPPPPPPPPPVQGPPPIDNSVPPLRTGATTMPITMAIGLLGVLLLCV